MVFSLERFRRDKPSPPFELGGVFDRHDETCFLCDSLGQIELQGEESLFRGLNSGDLVAVRVKQAEEFGVYCDKVIRHHATSEPGAPASRPHVTRFAAFVQRVRDFFIEQGLYEIFTPTLVRCPGLEPTLEPFQTEVVRGRDKQKAYLPTSPEISLKKAMTRGWTDIFEIKTCFRKGEFSRHHENEFLLLEWYRAFDNLQLVEQDLRNLIDVLGQEGWISGGAPVIEETDFAALFKDLMGFQLTPFTTESQLLELCKRLDVHTAEGDSFNDLFHRLVIDHLDPYLKAKGPMIVRRFPPSQAALAKFDPQGWTDRFEFFWRGFEIANAFNEVTDPNDQIMRWEAEMEEREHLKSSPVPSDPELITALKKGLPPTGGIALGLERLYMACADVEDIRELRLFATEDLFSAT